MRTEKSLQSLLSLRCTNPSLYRIALEFDDFAKSLEFDGFHAAPGASSLAAGQNSAVEMDVSRHLAAAEKAEQARLSFG